MNVLTLKKKKKFLRRKVWTTLGRGELTEAQVPNFKELKLHPR